MNKIGIVVAMQEEREAIENVMEEIENQTISNLDFYVGKIAGKKCIIVQSGVGKVNSARATQVLIDNYKVKTIVNIGAAGAVDAMLDIGDILIGRKAIQHDFDITAFGHSKGYITGVGNGVECNHELVEKVVHAIDDIDNKDYKTKVGVIATGDIFCTEVEMKDKISAKFDADVIDMECGAVAQVAYLSEIPFIAIRSISDTPNGNNASDFDSNLEKAATRCSEVLKEVVKNI